MMAILLTQEVELATEPTPVALRPHHAYKSWSTSWYDDENRRHCKRFGKEGQVTSAQARAAFSRWLRTDFASKPEARNSGVKLGAYIVADLMKEYFEVCKVRYVKRGVKTATVYDAKVTLEEFGGLFGKLPADDIEARNIVAWMLSAVMDSDGKKRRITTIAKRLGILKSAFKWARKFGKIGRDVLADVLAVEMLRRDECDALPAKNIGPVQEHYVAMVRDVVTTVQSDMLQVHWHTGMRPGELCQMRPCDIDRSKTAWVYRPASHKTEAHGKTRAIPLGPLAQAILTRYLSDRAPAAFIFSPIESEKQRLAVLAKSRKTPMNQGNRPGKRWPAQPPRKLGDAYNSGSYRRFVHYACKRVEKAAQMKDSKATFPKIGPNQIRHAYAQRVRDAFGIEAVADNLGHSTFNMSAMYAERSLSRAMEVALKVG